MALYMLHISKTGGTAIRSALRPAGRRPRTTFGSLVRKGHRLTLADVPPDAPVFFCVRDPVDRFLSSFYSRLRKGRPHYEAEWRAGEARAFARFHTPRELAGALADEDPRAVKAMKRIPHVNWPLTRWLIGPQEVERRLGHLYVARQEFLDEDWLRLAELFGLPEETWTLPKDPKDAHRAPGGEDRSLDPRSEAAIRDWYRKDYEILEVCDEARRRIQSG